MNSGKRYSRIYSNEENALLAQIASIEIRIKGLEQERSLLLERFPLVLT